MLALGNRANSAALYAGGGHKLAPIELQRMPSEFNFILMLAQSETERLLTEQLTRQGVKVERGVEVLSVRRAGPEQPVEVTLRSGDGPEEVLTASYLIAADGPHSTLRKALGVAFPGRTLPPHNYVLADLHIDGDVPQDQVSIFLAGGGGFIAVFPMGHRRFRLMATDPDKIIGDDGEPTVAQIQFLYDRAAHIPARLHTPNWSSRFRINSRHVRALRSGRVFFGGDAAHVHSPAGGQGMNLGIQDMINLSWKLAMVLDGRAMPELLDTYDSERLPPVIRRLIRFTEIGTRIFFNSTNPVVHAVRIRMAPRHSPVTGSRMPPRRCSASFPPVTATPPRSPKTAAVSANSAQASECPMSEGCTTRSTCRGLTLFVGDESEAVVELGAPGRCRHGPRGFVQAPGTWLLVRPPDAYLAAAGVDPVRLDRWLNRWFVKPAARAH